MRTVSIVAAALLVLAANPAHSAVPAGGTLTPSSGPLVYTAGPFTSVNPSPQLGEPDCSQFPNS